MLICSFCTFILFSSQLEAAGLDTGLVLYSEDLKMADVLFNVGSKNRTAILVVSLWQQMELLQGLMPTSLQVYLTLMTLIGRYQPVTENEG